MSTSSEGWKFGTKVLAGLVSSKVFPFGLTCAFPWDLSVSSPHLVKSPISKDEGPVSGLILTWLLLYPVLKYSTLLRSENLGSRHHSTCDSSIPYLLSGGGRMVAEGPGEAGCCWDQRQQLPLSGPASLDGVYGRPVWRWIPGHSVPRPLTELSPLLLSGWATRFTGTRTPRALARCTATSHPAPKVGLSFLGTRYGNPCVPKTVDDTVEFAALH